MPTAIRIDGRAPDARFPFVNDVYEPMQVQHNNMPAFVARGVAPRYLFHTGKGRWVISKVMDDGYKCWCYVKSGSSQSPADCKDQWQFCDNDNQWRADANVTCTSVPASNDVFVKLRMTLDADMKKYGLVEATDLKKLWRRLDFNGNNVVSLAEIDKLVVEMTKDGVWPEFLNSKPALMRAYKKTTLKDGDGDDWVQKEEFHALLLNIFWFAKLWQVFSAIDTDQDRRVDQREFIAGMSALGLNMSPAEAAQEFKKIDGDGGGMILFVELCAYIRNRVNPDDNANFDADILGGEHCDRAPYNKLVQQHAAAAQSGKGGFATRDIDFGTMMAQGGGASTGGLGASAKRTRQETLRLCGEGATLDHQVRPKALRDFDELEEKIKTLAQSDAQCKAMWRVLDFNGNNIVSLAEIDKWCVEQYPLLNHKPALMRCYKQTMDRKDEFVHRKQFKKLIVNLFYFNKLFWIFDQCDGDDRRIDLQEFRMVLTLCGMGGIDAATEFKKLDKNGGGQVLFDEFCHYFCAKVCPEGMADLIDDGTDRTEYDGTEQVLAMASHKKGATWRHGYNAEGRK